MGARRTYIVTAEPQREAYASLLRAGADVCSMALLMSPCTYTIEARKLLLELQPFVTDSALLSKWPGTEVYGALVPGLWLRFSPEMCEVLLRHTHRLFQWGDSDEALPEDLALFLPSGEAWLATVGHEHMAWLYLDEAERQSLSRSIAFEADASEAPIGSIDSTSSAVQPLP